MHSVVDSSNIDYCHYNCHRNSLIVGSHSGIDVVLNWYTLANATDASNEREEMKKRVKSTSTSSLNCSNKK